MPKKETGRPVPQNKAEHKATQRDEVRTKAQEGRGDKGLRDLTEGDPGKTGK